MNGRLKNATNEQCKQLGGKYFSPRQQESARKECKAEGLCCYKGQIEVSTASHCGKKGGKFFDFDRREEAEKMCAAVTQGDAQMAPQQAAVPGGTRPNFAAKSGRSIGIRVTGISDCDGNGPPFPINSCFRVTFEDNRPEDGIDSINGFFGISLHNDDDENFVQRIAGSDAPGGRISGPHFHSDVGDNYYIKVTLEETFEGGERVPFEGVIYGESAPFTLYDPDAPTPTTSSDYRLLIANHGGRFWHYGERQPIEWRFYPDLNPPVYSGWELTIANEQHSETFAIDNVRHDFDSSMYYASFQIPNAIPELPDGTYYLTLGVNTSCPSGGEYESFCRLSGRSLETIHLRQRIPTGSYLATCNDPIVSGNTLTATCESMRDNPGQGGRLHTRHQSVTSLRNYHNCDGDIANLDGNLVCNYTNDSYGGNPPPEGSYRQTCTRIRTMFGDLSAVCRKMGGNWQSARLENFADCLSNSISNFDGHLTCSRQGDVPPGSYIATCLNIREEGRDLKADCWTMGRHLRQTTLYDHMGCPHDKSNWDGWLVCGVQPNAGQPPGSYASTCTGAYTSNGSLYALCRDTLNRHHNARLRNWEQCDHNSISNDNGRLTCTRP